MDTLPVISLAKLKNLEHSDSRNEEHQRLYDVCYKHGFFYLSDHGILSDLVQQTIDASRNFFQLPVEIKNEYSQHKQKVYPKTFRGYVPLYGELLNQEVGFDPKEVFDLGFDKPVSSRPFTGPNFIPDDSVALNFAASHYNLQQAIMTKVFPPLLRGIALALGLEKNWFDHYFTEPTLIQRTIYYPPHNGQVGKHTDNGMLTILIQEDFSAPSLRVYTKEQWIDVPCLENTFVINLGDILQKWTDGLFVSTPHEVIHNLDTSRISIPFFIYPNIDATFPSFKTKQNISVKEVMLKNFEAIWVTHEGAGRAKELV